MDKDSKKKNIIIRVVCIIASFCLWLYINNIENPVREYKINSVPVEIANEDILKDLKLTMLPDEELKINVTIEGPANEVYKVKKSDIKIRVNLDGYALKKGDNKIPVEIVNYPSGVSIKNNEYLRVSVVLDDYVEKNVPVKNYSSIDVKKGFYKGNAEINPSTVKVSGAADYVNTVTEARVTDSFNDVATDINKTVSLKAYNGNGSEVTKVSVSPTTAILKVSITKGKMVKINVNTKGKPPEGVTLKEISEPKEVEILGDKSTLDKISQLNTEPVDLSAVNATKNVSVKIIIPENVTINNSDRTAEVTITVEKAITKNINLTLTASNAPDALDLTYDKSVSIVLSGEESAVSAVKESDIKAAIDLSAVKEGENSIDYTITGVPSGITVKQKKPDKVSVTAVKKQQ